MPLLNDPAAFNADLARQVLNFVGGGVRRHMQSDAHMCILGIAADLSGKHIGMETRRVIGGDALGLSEAEAERLWNEMDDAEALEMLKAMIAESEAVVSR